MTDRKIHTDSHIRALGEWFRQTGSTLYIVGGYVRNKLLGFPVGDVDICAAAQPDALRAIADERFAVSGRAYGLGTVMVTQHTATAEHVYEYTMFRTDSYGRGGAHRPDSVAFTEDIQLDALRRDFTVNALYADTQGNVVDPTGNALADLEQKRIVMVSTDTMSQDALRILRMIRFSAQLGFAIEPATFDAARGHVHNLRNISMERTRDELTAMLLADTAYGNAMGVLNALHGMCGTGALAMVIPELMEGAGFAQKSRYHRYDVLEHGLRTCAVACPDIRVRLAGLLHDVGKPRVFKRDGYMHRHAEESARMTQEILLRLRFGREIVRDVTALVEAHMFDLDNRAQKKTVLRMLLKLGEEQFLRLCCLREADFAGSGRGAVPESAQKWRDILAELKRLDAPLTRQELAVNGADLIRELRIPPGVQLGALLAQVHAYALKKPSQNDYKKLIRYAKMMYTEQIID